MEIITNNPEETQLIANRLSKLCKDGDLITLNGNLGAGKTTFSQGFCKGLNYNKNVTSPSYTLINEYLADYKIYHIDLYRLEEMEDSLGIGIEEYLPANDGICLVEWAEKFPELLPVDLIEVNLNYLKDNQRKITIIFKGKYSEMEANL